MIHNRLQASLFGLSATFDINGSKIPVSKLLKDIILKLGINLSLIELMIEKRYSQADLQIELWKCNNDPISFIWDYLNLINQVDFRDVLKEAEPRPICAPVAIADYLYSRLEKDSKLINVYEILELPFPDLDKVLEGLKREGKIRIRSSPERDVRIWPQRR
jgi:hypothetical protein